MLDHHRQGALYRAQQARKVWHEPPQRPASDIAVGIMGLGNLGRAAAQGAEVARLPRQWLEPNRAGDATASRPSTATTGLVPFLNATDILVVLLPLTPATRGIITYALLRELRRRNGLGGAVLINAGRGKLQIDADIHRALEDGTLKEASLDVFETEPLPESSPLWNHPRVFVTPHAAATSDPDASGQADARRRWTRSSAASRCRTWSIWKQDIRGRLIETPRAGRRNRSGPP